MNPARSSISAGIVATLALLAFLLVVDLLFAGTDIFVFATFTSLCSVGGGPYCELGSPTATGLTLLWFGLLYAVAWPLLFGAFTWGLPGESGTVHGVLFGFFLWVAYAAVALNRVGLGGQPASESLPMVFLTLFPYLLYGAVLGGLYDYFAEHRTFLTDETLG